MAMGFGGVGAIAVGGAGAVATAFGALALLITGVLDAWVELDVKGELGVLGLEVDGLGLEVDGLGLEVDGDLGGAKPRP